MMPSSLFLPPPRPGRWWALRRLSVLLLAVICTAAGVAQPAQKLSLAQIEDLIAHGVPDPVLSNQIGIHGISFSVTTAAVEELRAKGAGPRTLSKIESLKPPPPPPPPRPGKIEIETEPGSEVFLDAKPVGNANAIGRLTLPAVIAGNHKLSARVEGYQESIAQVSLAANEEKHVALPLEWLGGFLSVAATPEGAKITVVGPKSMEGTFDDIKCPPGAYTVAASLEGYLPETRTVQLASKEHHSETFALRLDPAVLARNLKDAGDKLAAGDAPGALGLAESVSRADPSLGDAFVIVAQAAFQLGDMNRFQDAGANAIRHGKRITVRVMHVHSALALSIHPIDLAISDAGIFLASNPPDSHCNIPGTVGYDLIQDARVQRDPRHTFPELHIQYASKPHGVMLHDLDFVPAGSQKVTPHQPGQIVIGGGIVEVPPNADQTLGAILNLMMKARRH
jgi:hypothetical protein